MDALLALRGVVATGGCSTAEAADLAVARDRGVALASEALVLPESVRLRVRALGRDMSDYCSDCPRSR